MLCHPDDFLAQISRAYNFLVSSVVSSSLDQTGLGDTFYHLRSILGLPKEGKFRPDASIPYSSGHTDFHVAFVISYLFLIPERVRDIRPP